MASTYAPPIRRKDSVGLAFSEKPDNELINRVVFDVLRINVSDLVGFQLMPRNRIIIKFGCHSAYEKFICEYDEKVFDTGNGINVKVKNLSSTFSYVSVRYAPFDMDNETIKQVLSRYGKVDWIRHNQHTTGKGLGLLNGIRTARMEIRSNIPKNSRDFRPFCIFPI